jgi:hypothetical protein
LHTNGAHNGDPAEPDAIGLHTPVPAAHWSHSPPHALPQHTLSTHPAVVDAHSRHPDTLQSTVVFVGSHVAP